MNRDTVKTLIGLVIIGGIVVATFMYGNSQRQAQLKHDQDVKKQQTAASPSTDASATPVATTPASTATPATPKPTVVPTATPKAASPSANTAPVKSPATNTLQGSGGTGNSLGASATPAATQTPATTPATGGTGQAGLPETGPGTVGIIGFAAIAFMLFAVRGSRRAIVEAARGRR